MKDKILTDHEFNQVIQSLKGKPHEKRNICLMYFSCYLGLRAKEMAGLKVVDVFRRDYTVRDEVELKVTKNNKKDLIYLIDPDVVRALEEHLYDLEWGKSTFDKPLFMSQKGGAFTPNTMQQLFHRIYREAGIDGATSHTGRRTCIKRWIFEKKAPLSVAQAGARHNSAATTLIYAKVNPDELKQLFSGKSF